jgi:prepilin-type N-terminal cleavage/methylation domain-containing protein
MTGFQAPGSRLQAPGPRARRDRGFSLIEAMVASVVMLIGMLGLAALQVVGVRANNIGKRMAQASLLGQDLAQNMQIWAYTDSRLTPINNTSTYHLDSTDGTVISKYWDLTSAQAPTSTSSGAVNFDYSDGPSAGWVSTATALNANYEGVMSPVDSTLPAGEQTIFTRYWNVFNVDLSGSGVVQGKLVQIIVRWKEPNFGYRTVTHSFFKYDPTEFNL